MKAVLLAAGRGGRLGPLTSSLPKALIPVAGRPLIDFILALCEEVGCEEILVVGGFGAYQLEAYLERRHGRQRFLINRQFREGNLLSLLVAWPYLNDEFLIANIDHIYPASLFRKFVSAPGGVICACDFDRPLGADDMKIRGGSGGRLAAIGKKLTVYEGGYIGMTRVTPKEKEYYGHAVQVTLGRQGVRAVVEDVLKTLIQWGENPSLVDLSGSRWWEVDTPEELQRADQALSRNAGDVPG